MSSHVRHNASGYEVRPIVDGEWKTFWDHLDFAFHERLGEEERKMWAACLPIDRTISVWDDGELVGTAASFPFEMTVPGARSVKTSGLTMVGVKATHRRRGLLTTMMRKDLHGIHEAGQEPVSILMASEPVIYGRFGYGLGTVGITLSVPRGPHRLAAVAGSDKYRLRIVDPREAYDACDSVFRANVARRPGMLARNEPWKETAVFDVESWRHGAGQMRCVVAEAADGTVAAYARYRVKEEHGSVGRPGSKVMLVEAYGTDTAPYAAVWRFLLDLDLTDEVRTTRLPVDDPIHLLLTDTRSAQPMVRDAMYTRLVDVDRALVARSYAAPVDVVLEVADEFCPWNAGRWRLTGDASGAVCERTTDAADLLVGIRELGSAYLGGTTLAALGRASRVEELTSGALAAASLAFTSDPAPYLPFGF